jgi:hypothetical protein
MAIGAVTLKNGYATLWDETATLICKLPLQGVTVVGYTPTRVTVMTAPPLRFCFMYDATGKYVGGFMT